ncbi:MAG: ferritin-like domain-containing protein [Bacteriovoracia bacterium]
MLNWAPFFVQQDARLAPRPLSTKQGIGDRLRTAAFAELQAEHAFVWAANTFSETFPELKKSWQHLAKEEAKHRSWLLNRLAELNQDIADRPVSDALWRSLVRCKSAKEFSFYMADAERRGQRAGERFFESLRDIDPSSAEIFQRIAIEEKSHIALATRFFPTLLVEKTRATL